MQKNIFLQKLEQEAAVQAQIQTHKVMPKRLTGLANLVGRDTWRVLIVISGLWALVKTYLL